MIMKRHHVDLHFVPADKVPQLLKLALDAGIISESRKDLDKPTSTAVAKSYPVPCAVIKVISFY